MDQFEEHAHFPDAEVRENAYHVLLEAYHTALMPIWNLAWFADIEMVLKTVADKQMTELAIMSKKLAPPPNTSQVSKETRKVPDLEMFTKALKDKHPAESLPSVESVPRLEMYLVSLQMHTKPTQKLRMALQNYLQNLPHRTTQ